MRIILGNKALACSILVPFDFLWSDVHDDQMLQMHTLTAHYMVGVEYDTKCDSALWALTCQARPHRTGMAILQKGWVHHQMELDPVIVVITIACTNGQWWCCGVLPELWALET